MILRYFLIILILSTGISRAQSPTYYHDAALDTIASGMVQLHQDLQQTNPVGFTDSNYITDNANLGKIMYQNYVTNDGSSNVSMTWLLANTNLVKQSGQLNVPLSNAVNSVVKPFSDGMTNNSMISTGVPSLSSAVIDLGYVGANHFTMDLSAGAFGAPAINKATEFANFQWWLRTIISTFVWLGLFVACVHYLTGVVGTLMGQQQLSGHGQSILGTNVKLPTGVAFAIIMSVTIVVALGLLAAKPIFPGSFFRSVTSIQLLFSNAGNTSNVIGHDMGVAWTAVWSFFANCVPMGEIIVAYLDYLAFRYLYGWPLFTSCRGIVLWFLR